MYCWDCMRVRRGVREGDYNECWACMRLKRGAMYCCVWEFMRFFERSMRVVERGYVIWGLFRESCMRVIERGDGQIIIGISRDSGQRRDQTNWTRHDQARLMGNDQASLTTFKIEYLRLGFPFSKPSLRDSSLKVAYVASVWSTRGNRVLDTQFPCKCQVAIRPHQNTETEPQRLDLQAQNRAFEARDVIKWYSFKTSLLTKWFGFYGHLAIFAQN